MNSFDPERGEAFVGENIARSRLLHDREAVHFLNEVVSRMPEGDQGPVQAERQVNGVVGLSQMVNAEPARQNNPEGLENAA